MQDREKGIILNIFITNWNSNESAAKEPLWLSIRGKCSIIVETKEE